MKLEQKMIDRIGQKQIDEVISLYDASIEELPAWKTQRSRIKAILPLSSEAIWLFNFISWFAMRRNKIEILDPSECFFLPKTKIQEATFVEFLSIALHKHKKSQLYSFFSRCTDKYRDFYLKVYTRFYYKNVPAKVFREYADLTLIDIVDIYTGGLNKLNYPVGVFAVPTTEEYSTCVFYRKFGEDQKDTSFYFSKLRSRPSSKLETGINFTRTYSKLFAKDRKFITQSEFVLVGLYGKTSGKFLPYDYFDTVDDYSLFKKTKKGKPYSERVNDLRRFFTSNIVFNIQEVPISVACNEYELTGAIFNTSSVQTDACEIKLSTGFIETFKITQQLLEGVVSEIWGDGTIRGFEMFHNLKRYKVSLADSVKNSSYVANFSLIQGRLALFHKLTIGTTEVCVFKEILWDKKPYRTIPLVLSSGESVWVEKCTVCGSQTHMHVKNGVCHSTLQALAYFIKKYGVDTWFTFGERLIKKRKDSGWEPDMFREPFPYKGYLLVGDAQGRLMFKSDEATMEKYKEFLKAKDSFESMADQIYWKEQGCS